MIRRLKRNFIIINMTIVGVILLVIFITINIFNYRSQLKSTNMFLTQVIESNRIEGSSAPPSINTPPPESEKPRDEFLLPFAYAISVVVHPDGEYEILENEFDIDESELDKIINQALSGSENGFLYSHKLIYQKRTYFSHSIVAFTSTEPIQSSLISSSLVSVALFVLCMLLMFFISERLANYTIKPVENAWIKQKQFIADASHELKTPLTVILANNDILITHTDSTISEEKKWIDSTRLEAIKMKGLVEKMLDLAKSEAENNTPIFTEESISELTNRIILQFEGVAFENGVVLDYNIEKDLIANTCGDFYTRIINILIDNAIKYSPQGEGVTISLSAIGRKIQFSVTNMGEPIPEDEINSVFERFYRGDKSRSTLGYGLGLSIARNLTEAIGGSLQVKSSTQGTTFSLSIKRKI
ncbi:MAG: HAMP domain-containing histidine kinase [Clostridia bacterium]|nr:HAMP domain-containing histidine kinase [Clostridia bacterium]